MTRYVEAGGNFIDTADVYNGGESERVIGRWLAQQSDTTIRERIILATKVFFQGGRPDPNRAGLGRSHVMRTIDESLSRLQTDYIDVLQIHNFDAKTNVAEWLRTMADAIASGKIRHYGVCNVCGWRFRRSSRRQMHMVYQDRHWCNASTLCCAVRSNGK